MGDMVPAMLDTTPEARHVLLAAWRDMAPAAKAQAVDRLSLDVTELALTGIRTRHPDATPEEARMRLGALRYGAALMREAFGWDPAVHGY